MSANRKRLFIILGCIAIGFLIAKIIALAVGETVALGFIVGTITVILLLAFLFISYREENRN